MVRTDEYIKYSIPYPTIGDIIDKRNYDYVSYRLWCDGEYREDGIFAGCFSVKDGIITPLDGDIYNKNEKVIASKEWTNEEEGVYSGLTIVVR